MFFPEQKLIFIHVPKTGGNFFSRTFIRFSSDNILARANSHQDRKERFAVRGPVTRHKHQTLAEYQARLGGRLDGYRVVTILRPPLARLLSLYFSPHRWMRADGNGGFRLPGKDEIRFRRDEFEALVVQEPSTCQMIGAGYCDMPPTPAFPVRHRSGATIRLIEFDDLPRQIAEFAREQGFTLAELPERALNRSANAELKDQVLRDMPDLADFVLSTHHARDTQLLA